MITDFEILETTRMFNEQHLDVRTITMGISLTDCASATVEESCRRIYDKICKYAGRLVEVGDEISEYLLLPFRLLLLRVIPTITHLLLLHLIRRQGLAELILSAVFLL